MFSGHCQKFTPEYEAAAQALSNSQIEIPLAKLDASESSDLI